VTATRHITLERTYSAPIDDVWDLWTTKDGIESWWGPDGFRVEVRSIDVRPGGFLHYAMIADAPEMVAFMQKNAMPTVQEVMCTYTEVLRPRRLGYDNLVDFVPGVEAYNAATLVELHPIPDGVRLILRLDAMHDEVWTQRAVQGWEMELGKLDRLIAGRVPA
jgi:uncharacterized protein YndB with AHSA1/START domain